MSSTAQKWTGVGRGRLRLSTVTVPDPRADEVTIEVRAVGVNPVDALNASSGSELGFEVAGVVAAVGPGAGRTRFELGEPVLSFRVHGGYATALTVPARDVFRKPSTLPYPEASNLLLAGSAAAEMLYRTETGPGDVVLIHGASGAVGISTVQQARQLGARVIGTAAEKNFELLRRFGAEPVTYGLGLEARVRALAPSGVDVALDAVGTDEAIDVSLALVANVRRIASSAAFRRAGTDGFWIAGYEEGSAEYRDSARPRLIELAGAGDLVVPLARTFAFSEAEQALRLVASGHAGGKLALIV